jgi:hypothetical protein
VVGPIENDFTNLLLADVPIVSRTLELFEATTAEVIGLATGQPQGLLTGTVPTNEARQTVAVIEVVAGGAGTIKALGFKAAGGAVTILEREGNVIIGSFQGAAGEARVITELVTNGDTLILRGTHIEGSATLREGLDAAAQFGRDQGARRVIIEGGRRTTGANPGHVPRPITVETGL